MPVHRARADGSPTTPKYVRLGGGGWIRTSVGVSQQIYSLPPLATRAPLRGEPQSIAGIVDAAKHLAQARRAARGPRPTGQPATTKQKKGGTAKLLRPHPPRASSPGVR